MYKVKKLEGPFFNFHNKPRKLIFLLHGYGDNAENFLPIAEYLNDIDLIINYYVPNAPFSVTEYPTGKQWFDPYPKGNHYSNANEEQKKTMEEECKFSINKLQEYIDNISSKNNLNTNDCFLIGFSQGAMIAYELGKLINKTFAGCVMLSGRILTPNKKENHLFIKTPLLIVHGDKDEIVDPKYYDEACKIAKSRGFSYENYLLKGEGHTISPKMIEIVKKFIKKYV